MMERVSEHTKLLARGKRRTLSPSACRRFAGLAS